MTTSLFGGFGDQSLRKIVGELPTRYETAAAARAGSCPQPAQQLDARAREDLRRVVGEAGGGDHALQLRVAARPW
jgi:Arc/MetJ family transcription regulator